MTAKMQESLNLILAKLINIENAIAPQSAKVAQSSEEAVLREKLDHLTVKRHAVLTASLGGVGYQELAKIMECNDTTIKLHLKAALNALDIPSRSVMLVSHKNLLSSIPDTEYEKRYHIGKRWWLDQKPALMEVLRTTKPTNNQFKKEST
jgi:FixJ family two-component response regulator